MKNKIILLIALVISFALGVLVQQHLSAGDIRKELMSRAVADNDVLTYNNKIGDRFGVPRDVDFYFIVKSKEKAEYFAIFLNDYAYGDSSVEARNDNSFGVKLIIHMPITQSVLLSTSGFMAVLAKTFNIEYVGWGSVVQNETPTASR